MVLILTYIDQNFNFDILGVGKSSWRFSHTLHHKGYILYLLIAKRQI